MDIVSYIYGNQKYSYLLRKVLFRFKLYYPYNLFLMKKNQRKPTQQMVDARKFYGRNKKRIQSVCGFLSDQKSVDTFEKLIHMRQYYNIKDIPDYSYSDQYFPNDIEGFTGLGG